MNNISFVESHKLQEEHRLLKAINKALVQLLSGKDMYTAMREALQLVCETIGCDGVYLFNYTKLEPAQITAQVFFGVRQVEGQWTCLPNEAIVFPLETPVVHNRLENMLQQNTVTTELIADAPDRLRQLLTKMDVASYMSFRVMVEDQLWGGISFVSRQESLDWTKDRYLTLIPFVYSIGNFVERRQAQENLIAQRDYFKQIIDVSPNPIFVRNEAGILTLVNRACVEGSGNKPEDLLGKKIQALVPNPEEAAYIEAEDKRILETQKPVLNTMRRFSDGKGKSLHFLLSKVPLQSKSSSPREIVTVLTNMTESVGTKQRLQEEKRFSEHITNLIPDWVIVVNFNERRFDYHNLKYPILGFSEEECNNPFELLINRLHPEDIGISHTFIINLNANKEKQTILEKHFRLQHKDGRWLYFYERAIAMSWDEQGNVKTYLAIIQDITSFKKTQTALQQSENILKATINALPDLKFRLGKDGTYFDFYESENESIQPIAPRSVIIGKRIPEVMPPHLTPAFMENLQKAVEERKVQVLEYILEPSSQDKQYREVRFSPINENEVIAVVRDISERKHAEEALKRSQERYQNFIQHSQEGIYYMDCGKPIPLHLSYDEMTNLFYESAFIEECNAALTKMYGLTVEEMKGRKVIEFHGGEHFEQNKQSFRELIENGFQIVHVETIEPGAEGNYRYFLNNGVGIIENNHLLGFWGTQLDITERKQAEEALRKSEAWANLIFNSTTDLMFLMEVAPNEMFRCVRVNPAYLKVSGLQEEHLIGKTPAEILSAEEAAFVEGRYREVIQKRQSISYEEIAFFRGKHLIVETSLTPIFDANGNCTYLLGVARDISERKKAATALQENRQVLKAIVDALPDLKFRLNREGVFLDYYESEYENEALLTPPGEFIGKKMAEVLPPFVADIGMTNIQQAIKTRQIQTFEYYIPVQDELFYYEGRVSPIGETEVIIAVRNISDRKKAQFALQEKLRELDDKNKQLTRYIESNFQLEHFAYIASHDLREPVRTVHSFAQLLSKKYRHLLDEDGHKCLDFIIYGAENMNRLIEDLLAYARVGSQEHQAEPVSVTALLRQLTTGLSQVVQEKNADVVCLELPDQISANPTTLYQLFQNLIINAIKFHLPNQKPVINISGIEHGDAWLFEVKDNGIGIPAGMQEKIFQLFKKIHYTKDHHGTGIGLAICKRIVEQHGGEIWVESAPNQGSSFYFTIKK